jgi:riboflavin synthase alpha subunit
MAAQQHVGAAAPGLVTPTRSDEARVQPGFIEGITEVDSQNFATEALSPAMAVSPLRLACTCGARGVCLTCTRWRRHELAVRARRQAWRAGR